MDIKEVWAAAKAIRNMYLCNLITTKEYVAHIVSIRKNLGLETGEAMISEIKQWAEDSAKMGRGHEISRERDL